MSSNCENISQDSFSDTPGLGSLANQFIYSVHLSDKLVEMPPFFNVLKHSHILYQIPPSVRDRSRFNGFCINGIIVDSWKVYRTG